jgi:hypothetical protein
MSNVNEGRKRCPKTEGTITHIRASKNTAPEKGAEPMEVIRYILHPPPTLVYE